jgi:hypothetical protein
MMTTSVGEHIGNECGVQGELTYALSARGQRIAPIPISRTRSTEARGDDRRSLTDVVAIKCVTTSRSLTGFATFLDEVQEHYLIQGQIGGNVFEAHVVLAQTA